MRAPTAILKRTMSAFAPSTLNPRLKDVQYAVRGEIAIKAEKYRDQLKNPNHGLPFDRVITANIGNPQQKGLDQPPLTFGRQVSAFRTRRVVAHHHLINPRSLRCSSPRR